MGQPVTDPQGSGLSQSRQDQPDSVEFSTPLESETPLEAPKPLSTAVPRPSVPLATGTSPAPVPSQSVAQPSQAPLAAETLSQPQAQPALEPSVAEATIALLEERLVIDTHRRKVGEVVVRKAIETRLVQVPVRREKLIVEQVSPEYQQLAVVDLGQQDAEMAAVEAVNTASAPMLRGEFSSVKAAIQFLEAVAAHSGEDAQKVHLGVLLQDAAMQATAQRWLEQYAAQKAANASS